MSKYWWQPIGVFYLRDSDSYIRRYFLGNYDGNNYTISGLFAKSDSKIKQGLFGSVEGTSSCKAIIKNVGIIESFIKGGNGQIGALIGMCKYTTIQNCYNLSGVEGKGQAIGGLVGVLGDYSTLDSCYNNGNVVGTYMTGGLVGRNDSNSLITNSFNKGEINGGNATGGICGNSGKLDNYDISNCYNLGKVSGTDSVGGIIGCRTYSGVSVYNCFNLGSIEFTKNYVGGIIGKNDSKQPCYNSYFGGDCVLDFGEGSSTAGSGTNKGTTKSSTLVNDAKNLSWYNDSTKWHSSNPWDFENIWGINSNYNNGYPTFKQLFPYKYKGEGTEESPYLIDSERALRLMSNNINSGVDNSAYFKQTADICIGEEEWTPIGYSLSIRFSGVYDGLGHFISGIRIMSPEGDCKGVFGCIGGTDSSNYAVVKNLNIINSYVQGFNHVGSIAGCLYSNYGKIENCTSKSTMVIATGDCAGGICGTAVYDSIINNCSNSASVKGKRNIGGIVGELNSGSQVSNCFNYGNLEGETENVGGIVGLLRSNIIVSNSISNCVITSVKGVGSIIGSGSGTIRNCSGYGMLYGVDEGKCGAILGDANGMPKLENCSFFGNSNLEIGFFCGNTSTTSWMTDGCFTTINNRKSILAGDYSEWSIVPNMNYDLPMQNELYSIAIGNFTSNEIIDYLKNLGFGLSS